MKQNAELPFQTTTIFAYYNLTRFTIAQHVDSTYPTKVAMPGEIKIYTFAVPWSVEPGDSDPQCLTYLYYSNYILERDVPSGLIGPLMICKPGVLDPITNVQVQYFYFRQSNKVTSLSALFYIFTTNTRKICDAMHHGSRNVLDYNFKNISVTLTLYHTVEF